MSKWIWAAVVLVAATATRTAASAAATAARRSSRQAPFAEDNCRSTLELNAYTKLNKICDDCFALYKEPEVYTLCRSDCFGTRYFYGCMETLFVKDELKNEVAAYLEDVHRNFFNVMDK